MAKSHSYIQSYDLKQTLSRLADFLGPRPHTNCTSGAVCGHWMARLMSTPTSLTRLTNSRVKALFSSSLLTVSCRTQNNKSINSRFNAVFDSPLTVYVILKVMKKPALGREVTAGILVKSGICYFHFTTK